MGITQRLAWKSYPINNVQAFGDQTNSSVLWLKYNLININKTNIFMIQSYFLYFYNVNNDHGTFFNSRIRFLLWSNQLRIDTLIGRFKKIMPSYCRWIQQNRAQSSRNSNQLSLFNVATKAATTRWLVAIMRCYYCYRFIWDDPRKLVAKATLKIANSSLGKLQKSWFCEEKFHWNFISYVELR